MDCVFDEKKKDKCKCLTKKDCNNCTFKKTHEEYKEGKEKALKKLKAKYNQEELKCISEKYGIRDLKNPLENVEVKKIEW